MRIRKVPLMLDQDFQLIGNGRCTGCSPVGSIMCGEGLRQVLVTKLRPGVQVKA